MKRLMIICYLPWVILIVADVGGLRDYTPIYRIVPLINTSIFRLAFIISKKRKSKSRKLSKRSYCKVKSGTRIASFTIRNNVASKKMLPYGGN